MSQYKYVNTFVFIYNKFFFFYNIIGKCQLGNMNKF